MSTISTSAATPLLRAIDRDLRKNKVAQPHGRSLSRLLGFLDRLPEAHGDVDLEVLKRVPTPI